MKKALFMLLCILVSAQIFGEETVAQVSLGNSSDTSTSVENSENVVATTNLRGVQSESQLEPESEDVIGYVLRCIDSKCDIVKKDINPQDSSFYFNSIDEAKLSASYGKIDTIEFRNYVINTNLDPETQKSPISMEDLEFLSNQGYDIDQSYYDAHYNEYNNLRTKYENHKCQTEDCSGGDLKNFKEIETSFKSKAKELKNSADYESTYQYVLNQCVLNQENCVDLITQYTDGAECVDSWLPEGLCTFFKDERLVENQVEQTMRDLNQKAKEECASNDISCYNEIFQDNLDIIEIDFRGNYAYYCVDKTTSCENPQKCGSTCNSENLFCTDEDNACQLAKKELDQTIDQSKRRMYTETSTTFDVIAALMNPDQRALAASELFGFESDYSDLPEWLTEDTASLICLAKIDGYLDTQVESQFEDSVGNTGARGITQYGCSLEEGLEFDPNTETYQPTVGQPCVEVLADIRAERTPVLPNEEIQLTYSGYLKAPPNVNVSYMIYASYRLENQSEAELQPLFLHRNGSLNIKTIPAGEDESFYNVVRIPENGTLQTPVGEEGVKLLLQAFFTDGSSLEEYVSIITPAYEITAGSYRDPLGQQDDDEDEDDEDDDDEGDNDPLDDGDILQNACQLIGTC